MNFGVNSKNIEDARNEFITVFSTDHLWFYELFLLIREIELNEGIKFTDVLIKQNKPVLVGIIKNFFSIYSLTKDKYRDKLKSFMIQGLSEMEIKDFVEKYINYKKNLFSANMQTMKPLKHFNFSLNLYGLGCFRCNFSTSDDGVSLNIRMLDFLIPKMEDLLSDYNPIDKRIKTFFESLVETKNIQFLNKNLPITKIKKGGLIIHAGPTGTGKSTFIASEIGFIADNISGIVITYEDPIEYRYTEYPKTLQVEIDSHLSKDEIYKHFLRNSPSVGSIHEIKTREEFLQAIDLASRGHLIFTTMHANNVKEVFSSFALFDKDVRQLFTTVLLAIICHKLEINEQGKIFPLLEVFLNDVVLIQDANRSSTKPVFKLFVDGDINNLENLLYVQKGYSHFYPFEQYVLYKKS